MAGIRKDVRVNGSGWTSELEWYAKAIIEMKRRPITDRTSFNYLAAIHGFDQKTWVDQNLISLTDALPPKSEMNNRIFSQCQHGGWFFLPWHRGYLASFEEIIAQTIIDLGGPNDWALPYWNYFSENDSEARNIPKAFTDPVLPDGKTPNPLSSPPRGSETIGPVNWFKDDISLDSMQKDRFMSANGATSFGGGKTYFEHFFNQKGDLEANPHNSVHVIIGGPYGGYMYDPDLAGLDPIFWLHHCNIDRLWAAWMTRQNNIQENGPAWSNGPTPRQFEMPNKNGSLIVFSPKDTLPQGRLAPEYDDLSIGTNEPTKIAALEGGAKMAAKFMSVDPEPTTLIGANDQVVLVGDSSINTNVKIDAGAVETAASMQEMRLFLNIENIKGSQPSATLSISVAVPDAKSATGELITLVKTVALFGLAKASRKDGDHAGNGINVAVDITKLFKELGHLAGETIDEISINLSQPENTENVSDLEIDRVSIYQQAIK